MNLQEVIEKLDLSLLTEPKEFREIEPASGYTSDLLSCVMASAKNQGLWITLQAHLNIVAIAALLELSAVIITEDAQPDPGTITKANDEGVTLLSTPLSSFAVAGMLWEMGLRER